MSIKKITFVLLTVFLLTASVIGVSAEEDQSITVTGEGTVSLTPDIIQINIGVNTEDSNITTAINTNTEKVDAIRKALLENGVNEKDIQTSNYSLYSYSKDMGNNQGSTFVYSVSNNYSIIVRDINKLNEILNTCIDHGANSINGITYDSTDRDNANKLAREAAIDAAIEKAKETADKIGVKLTTIQDIVVLEQGNYYGNSINAAVQMDSAITPNVSTGALTIAATVELKYGFSAK